VKTDAGTHSWSSGEVQNFIPPPPPPTIFQILKYKKKLIF